MAQKNSVIDEAVGTAYKLMLDERKRYRMEARGYFDSRKSDERRDGETSTGRQRVR